MSVSSNLLCSFELLKPLDSNALKSHIKKGRNARQNMLNSPVSGKPSRAMKLANSVIACPSVGTEFLGERLCSYTEFYLYRFMLE